MRAALLVFILMFGLRAWAQEDSTKTEKVPTGWGFGAVPALAYDTDLGFRYGAVVNLYDYGDGSTYPGYRHSIYTEWSKTTKGSMQAILSYDSEYLIPKVRMIAEASWITEQALDFYGFNGYECNFNANLSDQDHTDYISRMYYRHDRKFLRLKADFQGNIMGKKLRWIGGIAHYGIGVSTVNVDKLNRGKSDSDKLPNVPTLYDEYVNAGIITDKEKDGGSHNFIKAGIMYDTRDNQPNPMRGMWTELMLVTAPEFLGNSDGAFTKLVFTHRQYFTLVPKHMNIAYRVSYQPKLSGDIPFYMLPFMFDSYQTRDGLGGSKTVRGVLRNRIVGDDMLMANLELRYKMWYFKFLKQNCYLAASLFTDMGMITKEHEFITNGVLPQFAAEQKDRPHVSAGGGLHFAMNQNFIITLDYGKPFDKQDGGSGFYINLDFLF